MEALDLPDGYKPSENEPFMNKNQQIYFKRKLLDWRTELLKDTSDTIINLQNHNTPESDIIDIASNEVDHSIELRARDRDRKLLNKIEEAIRRLDDGNYGYCEESGEPISIRRLEARPIATLSIEAQERHERRERSFKIE
jgi:DnaK suppressor protein